MVEKKCFFESIEKVGFISSEEVHFCDLGTSYAKGKRCDKKLCPLWKSWKKEGIV